MRGLYTPLSPNMSPAPPNLFENFSITTHKMGNICHLGLRCSRLGAEPQYGGFSKKTVSAKTVMKFPWLVIWNQNQDYKN